MLGHLGLNVPDLKTAKAYYDQLMPLLGFTPFFVAEDEFSYRPGDGKPGTFIFFYPESESGPGYSRHRPGLQHLAFMVASRTAVRAVHERVCELGAEIVREPQHFPQYPPPYYATFWLDPFGFMLEAVCHRDTD
jgi:catechol 2,3-dioxygenase-like lactoylglutathione lyase family enzyme